jgi:hypothetical protein
MSSVATAILGLIHESVHAGDQDVLQTSVFEVGEYLEPELRPHLREASYRFRLANPETEEAFRALHRHAQNDVDGPLADSA